jgi:hypothetical protein
MANRQMGFISGGMIVRQWKTSNGNSIRQKSNIGIKEKLHNK